MTGLEVFNEKGISILSVDFTDSLNDIEGNHIYQQILDTMGLHIVDVNFDGYKDVIILNSFGGAHSNTWYDCWLWDVETSSFIKSESFAEICNPALDPEKKCIYSAGGGGATTWDGSIFSFIDGEFVVTNNLHVSDYGMVEKRLVNGAMEIVREEVFDHDDAIRKSKMEYYENDDLWQLNNSRWYMYGGHHADQWLE